MKHLKYFLFFALYLFFFSQYAYAQIYDGEPSLKVDKHIQIGSPFVFDGIYENRGSIIWWGSRYEGFDGYRYQALSKSSYGLDCPNELEDYTNPQAFLHKSIVTNLNNSGSTTLKAQDFDLNSYDNCGGAYLAYYDSNTESYLSEITITCDDLTLFDDREILEIEIDVYDASGNYVIVPVDIEVVDVFDACGNQGPIIENPTHARKKSSIKSLLKNRKYLIKDE